MSKLLTGLSGRCCPMIQSEHLFQPDHYMNRMAYEYRFFESRLGDVSQCYVYDDTVPEITLMTVSKLRKGMKVIALNPETEQMEPVTITNIRAYPHAMDDPGMIVRFKFVSALLETETCEDNKSDDDTRWRDLEIRFPVYSRQIWPGSAKYLGKTHPVHVLRDLKTSLRNVNSGIGLLPSAWKPLNGQISTSEMTAVFNEHFNRVPEFQGHKPHFSDRKGRTILKITPGLMAGTLKETSPLSQLELYRLLADYAGFRYHVGNFTVYMFPRDTLEIPVVMEYSNIVKETSGAETLIEFEGPRFPLTIYIDPFIHYFGQTPDRFEYLSGITASR